MKKIITLMAALAIFVGCDNDNKIEDDFIHTGVFLQLGMGADTRTSIGDKNPDTGKTPFLWSKGDALGIYCNENNASNRMVTIPSSADGQHEARISTDLEFNGTGDHTFYFYYPYDANQSTSFTTSVTKTLSANQRGLINANGFMYQSATTNSAAPEISFDMEHIFSYLRFFVVDDAADNTVSIINITFRNLTESAKLAGSYTANLTNGSTSFTSGSNSIFMEPYTTMYVTKKVPESKIGYPAMVINPTAVKSTDTLRVIVSFSDGKTAYVDVKGKTFAAQKIYNITLKTLQQDQDFKIIVQAWDEVNCDIAFN